MNRVCLIGRLTRDVELRYSSGETPIAIARWSVAVDRGRKDQQQTADFINCLAFGRTAEFAEKWFRKGLRIGLEGRIQTGSYTNKEGRKVYTTDVVADKLFFADGKDVAEPRSQKVQESEDFMAIPDSADDGGLPFN